MRGGEGGESMRAFNERVGNVKGRKRESDLVADVMASFSITAVNY